jgi:hypothetical protein
MPEAHALISSQFRKSPSRPRNSRSDTRRMPFRFPVELAGEHPVPLGLGSRKDLRDVQRVLAHLLHHLPRGIADRTAREQPHAPGGELAGEPSCELLRRIEPVTHVHGAPKDYRVVLLTAATPSDAVTETSKPRLESTSRMARAISAVDPYLLAAETGIFITRSFRLASLGVRL